MLTVSSVLSVALLLCISSYLHKSREREMRMKSEAQRGTTRRARGQKGRGNEHGMQPNGSGEREQTHEEQRATLLVCYAHAEVAIAAVCSFNVSAFGCHFRCSSGEKLNKRGQNECCCAS